MFLKNKNIIFKIKRSKVTDYAALNNALEFHVNPFWTEIYILRTLSSGSVVESLVRYRGVAGPSLAGGTALCHWARHFILCLVLVQPKDPSRHE